MFDKLKQLTKDTAVYGISTMVGRFLTFLLVPLYTNIFSNGDYGVVSNLYVFMGVFNVVLVYGMDASYLKFASSHEIGEDKDNFSTPYLSILIVSPFVGLAIYLFKAPIYAVLDVPSEFYYLIYYVVFILFLDAACVIPFIKLRLERKSKKFALYKIINIVVNVILNLVLILKLKLGIEAIFISNLAASLISFFLLFPDVLRAVKFHINASLLKRLLKFGLPYFPAGLAAMLIQGVDRPILTHLTNLEVTGIYSANYKLGIFMMLFVNMFQYAWQPFFLQHAKEENVKEMFSKILTYFTLAGSVILITISLFISDIATISINGHTIIGKEYLSGLVIVPIILLGYLFNGIYVIFTAGIYIEEKSIYVPVITGFGAFVNIAVNFALIPVLGMIGAALATLASYFVMALGYFFVTQKFYKINYEYAKIAKIFFLILSVGAAYYILMFNGQLIFFIKMLLLIIFLILLYIFAIEKKERDFIKKKLISSKV